MFLNQRAAAHDTATKVDVSTVGKEMVTYFMDGAGTIDLDFASVPGKVVLSDGAGYTTTVKLTNGTAIPTSGGSANLGDRDAWCVALDRPGGSDQGLPLQRPGRTGDGTC